MVNTWQQCREKQLFSITPPNPETATAVHAPPPHSLPRRPWPRWACWLVDFTFGKPASRGRNRACSGAAHHEGAPVRPTRSWFGVSVSATFFLLAFLCFLESRGYPPGSLMGLLMVAGPIVLGLAGGICGILARSVAMIIINIFAAFFLVPAYFILWEGYFF